MEILIEGRLFTDAVPPRALDLAKGRYQRNLLQKLETWSGSSLRGRARTYSDRYRLSRHGLFKRLQEVIPGVRLIQLRNGKPARNGKFTLLFPLTLAEYIRQETLAAESAAG
jgi:hypothetical protein